MSEMMDIGFSVFNGHINDADKKARAILASEAPDLLKRLERIEKRANGIMGIFDNQYLRGPADRAAAMVYSGMILALVNVDRLPAGP